MRFSIRQLCVFTLICASIVSIAPGQNISSRFIVGVLQENGAIIPFARYDGARWLNTWSAPAEPSLDKTPPVAPIPREWLGENPPTNWRLWLPNGTTHAIRATGPVYIKSCGENWGLNTDFPKVLNQRTNSCPTRAIGIVLSTDKKLTPFLPGNQSGIALDAFEKAAEAREIQQMRESNEAMAKLGARRSPSLGPDWDIASRARFPLRVEDAWAVQTDSADDIYYYVEAIRRFDNLESSQACKRFSAFRGWITQTLEKRSVLKVNVGLTDCDFKEAEFVTPMGLLELREGLFAIVQVNGWESQSYGIIRIGPAGVTTVLDSPVR
jgi:hypothetical protein